MLNMCGILDVYYIFHTLSLLRSTMSMTSSRNDCCHEL